MVMVAICSPAVLLHLRVAHILAFCFLSGKSCGLFTTGPWTIPLA